MKTPEGILLKFFSRDERLLWATFPEEDFNQPVLIILILGLGVIAVSLFTGAGPFFDWLKDPSNDIWFLIMCVTLYMGRMSVLPRFTTYGLTQKHVVIRYSLFPMRTVYIPLHQIKLATPTRQGKYAAIRIKTDGSTFWNDYAHASFQIGFKRINWFWLRGLSNADEFMTEFEKIRPWRVKA